MADALYTVGLIPAWAGKTPAVSMLYARVPAHPRVGGENGQGDGLSAVARGSSPRGRGKLVVVVLGVVEFRLIPAWAGKTTSSTPSRRRSRAHPRVGGENCSRACCMERLMGSSPRGRGKPLNFAGLDSSTRLIPAWAGKTKDGAGVTSTPRAHPRVGGENSRLSGDDRLRRGSSPRGRGKLLQGRACVRRSGLIPAWAGKTHVREPCG